MNAEQIVNQIQNIASEDIGRILSGVARDVVKSLIQQAIDERKPAYEACLADLEASTKRERQLQEQLAAAEKRAEHLSLFLKRFTIALVTIHLTHHANP